MKLKFKNHWVHGWYNRSEFNSQFPQLSIFNTNPEVIDLEDVNNDVNHFQSTIGN